MMRHEEAAHLGWRGSSHAAHRCGHSRCVNCSVNALSGKARPDVIVRILFHGGTSQISPSLDPQAPENPGLFFL